MSPVTPLPADEVDRFVRRLRGAFDSVYPAGWSIDWAAIPSPFRWYPDLPRIVLPPLPHGPAAGGPEHAAILAGRPLTEWLGGYLQACYGVTGVRWYPSGIAKSSPEEPQPVHRDPHFQLRRPVPSGGVTYPVECYVLSGGSADLAAGTYHYDATRHALAPLPVSRVVRPPWSARLVLTTPLWKNYFKYSDFSYRLGALDAGAVIGQFESVARRWHWSCRVTFDVDERDVLAHLGLDERDEAAVAVVDVDPTRQPDPVSGPIRMTAPAERPARWLGAAKRPPETNPAVRMHAACLAAHAAGAVHLPPSHAPDDLAGERVTLPAIAAEPVTVAASWSRTALGEQFRATALTLPQLSRWLRLATVPLCSDLSDAERPVGQVRCVVLARNVDGLDVGAYLAEPGAEALSRMSAVDGGPLVLDSMFGHYMNLAQAPVVVLLAGAAAPQHGPSGALAYRVQHHLAGLMAQRMLAAAAEDGVTGHPVLGFDSARLDRPLGLAEWGWTTLLLLPFGHYRRALYIESSVNPVAVRGCR